MQWKVAIRCGGSKIASHHIARTQFSEMNILHTKSKMPMGILEDTNPRKLRMVFTEMQKRVASSHDDGEIEASI